jgi:hypothetical protein
MNDNALMWNAPGSTVELGRKPPLDVRSRGSLADDSLQLGSSVAREEDSPNVARSATQERERRVRSTRDIGSTRASGSPIYTLGVRV